MLKDYLWTLAQALPFVVVGPVGRRASGAICAKRAKADAPSNPPASLPPPVIDLEAEPVLDEAASGPSEIIASAGPPLPEPPPEPARSATRRAVNPHEAVMRFCSWMRDWGFVGWHPAADIVGFYQWFCDEEGLEEMSHDLLRERFACAPGVTRERRRLNGTTDKEMVRIKRRLGDRAMLYRVASHEELAELAKSRKRGTRPARAGRKAGNKPKTVPNTVSATPRGAHASSMTRRAA